MRSNSAIGQAAGTAAAMCVEKKAAAAELNVKDLQAILVGNGVYLGD
jgi:hypothetical protein